LAFPIIAGISFFRWPIMRAWIFAALARFTNSLTCAWKWWCSYWNSALRKGIQTNDAW
jgi:hypothetical protein